MKSILSYVAYTKKDLHMNIREFIGHTTCSSRYDTLLQIIESGPLIEVIEIQRLNNELKRNIKYEEIKLALSKRLN
jgi:hypothetical protein